MRPRRAGIDFSHGLHPLPPFFERSQTSLPGPPARAGPSPEFPRRSPPAPPAAPLAHQSRRTRPDPGFTTPYGISYRGVKLSRVSAALGAFGPAARSRFAAGGAVPLLFPSPSPRPKGFMSSLKDMAAGSNERLVRTVVKPVSGRIGTSRDYPPL